MSGAQPVGVVVNGGTEPPPLQPIDKQDGEDVEMSGMIKQLHDETVAYFAVQTYVNIAVPRFYHTSAYYLYKMVVKKGLRPIQLFQLGDTVKGSIQRACPEKVVPDFPTLQQIVEAFQHLEGGTRETAEEQRDAAHTEFSLIFVNYMTLVKALYERDRSPPRYLHFLHQFCILFGKFNSGNDETKYQWKICELLRPLFPSLASTHFNNLYSTINEYIGKLDLHVTFTPRSL